MQDKIINKSLERVKKYKLHLGKRALINCILLIVGLGLNSYGDNNPDHKNVSSDNEEETLRIDSLVIAKLMNQLPIWLSSESIPGVAVAVLNNEGIIWSKEYGFTDTKGSLQVNSQTLFSVQSISKSFTAVAVLTAVEQGILDLDVPITNYLPEFTVNSKFEDHPERIITLRHLLAHKAGFTHEAPIGNNSDCNSNNFEEHIQSISKTWLRYPVGYRFAYSNLGIDLAGYIIEVKTGIPFWKYLDENVLKPIGMESSSFNRETIHANRNLAIGHFENIEIKQDIPMIPAGGLFSNIEDMAKYLSFHLNKGVVDGEIVLKKDLIDQMQQVNLPYSTESSGYGLGINIEKGNNPECLYHSGLGFGYQAFIIFYPEYNLGIVVLANGVSHNLNEPNVRELVNEIIIGKESTEKESTEKESTEKESTAKDYSNTDCISLDNSDPKVKDILGYYSAWVKLESIDDKIGLSFGDNFFPFNLYLKKNEIVGVSEDRKAELMFLPRLNNRPGSIVYIPNSIDGCFVYDYLKPIHEFDQVGPRKEEWLKYQGIYEASYYSGNKMVEYEISTVNGYLYIDWMRCFEHSEGLFFTFEGEALDFRGEYPTFRNVKFIKTKRF